MPIDPDDDLISSIRPDAMTCLGRCDFFEKLDDVLSPEDKSHQPNECWGTFELSEHILVESGFTRTDLDDIFGVLRSQGGFCDCEILYNVAKSSRLKSEYWRSRANRLEDPIKHLHE
jgi:hypothetical protein